MSEDRLSNAESVPSILFVCTGNTCRSVFAEALTRRRFGTAARVSSAGLRPQPAEDAKNAIDTLRFDFSIDISSHIPRSVRDLDLNSFDVVVAMDKAIARELSTFSKRKIVIWSIQDPWGG